MNEVVESISERTITAFLLLMVLVWLFVAVGVVLAGLLRSQLPRPLVAIMDPTGTAEARGKPPVG